MGVAFAVGGAFLLDAVVSDASSKVLRLEKVLWLAIIIIFLFTVHQMLCLSLAPHY